MVKKPLTKTEQDRREELEAIVDGAQDDASLALAALKAEKLYRPLTWAKYCEQRFGLVARTVDRRIEAALAKTGQNLSDLQRDSQARALAKIPEDRRAEAWDAVAADGKPTAARLKAFAEESGGKPPDEFKQFAAASKKEVLANQKKRRAEREQTREEKLVASLRRTVEKARVETVKLNEAVKAREMPCVGLIDVDQFAPIREEVQMLARRIGDLWGRGLRVIDQTASVGLKAA